MCFYRTVISSILLVAVLHKGTAQQCIKSDNNSWEIRKQLWNEKIRVSE